MNPLDDLEEAHRTQIAASTNSSIEPAVDLAGRALSVLANSDRRLIVELLALCDQQDTSGISISRIAVSLQTTRFSAARHLRILREGGLVTTIKRGNTTFCAIRVDTLLAIEDWIVSLAPLDNS